MDEYPKVFMVGVDNVGSKQMQQIRHSLRGKAEILMGKNTMIRKAIRGHLDNNPDLEKWVFSFSLKCMSACTLNRSVRWDCKNKVLDWNGLEKYKIHLIPFLT